jgi:hypothetical protein
MTTAAQAPVNTPGNGSLAKRPVAEPSRESTPGVSNLMDAARFAQLSEVAKVMAYTAPEHLLGKDRDQTIKWKQTVSNCFRIANQAFRWGMDPFAVMDETYVVKGKLGYGGKLVAGVVNSRAKIEGSLRVKYNSKSGDEFAAVIYGATIREIPREAEGLLLDYAENESRKALNALDGMGICAVRISVGQSKTDNQMWRNDPEQKLFYSGSTKWARRHQPQLILGIVTDDDIERMAATSGISSGGTSLVHRSALNDTLTDGEALPVGEATTDATGTDASGLGELPEGQTTTVSDESNKESDTSLGGGKMTEKGTEFLKSIRDAAGNGAKLTAIGPELVKFYKRREDCLADPEAQAVYAAWDSAIEASKKK